MQTFLLKLLIDLKNSSLVQKTSLNITLNLSYFPILRVLYKQGYILSYIKNKKNILIKLRYYYNKNALKNIKIMSNASKPVYLTKFDVFKIREKNSLPVLLTSKGIFTSIECKKYKMGGILLFIC